MQITKAQAIAAMDAAKRNEWLNYETMSAQTEGKAIRVGQFTVDGSTVTAWLINSTRAHGGIIQFRSAINQQLPSFHCSYLEEEHTFQSRNGSQSEFAYQMRELVGKAMVMRNRALDEQAQAA